MTKASVEQSEFIYVGAQIDYLTICLGWEGVNFNYVEDGGWGNLKTLKIGWRKSGVGAGVFKRWGEGRAGTFPISFFQGLSQFYI